MRTLLDDRGSTAEGDKEGDVILEVPLNRDQIKRSIITRCRRGVEFGCWWEEVVGLKNGRGSRKWWSSLTV